MKDPEQVNCNQVANGNENGMETDREIVAEDNTAMD